MKKRLFVFCDGTWQDSVNNNSPVTNVATLARCLLSVDSKGYHQLVWYDSGVGNVTSTPAQAIDGATGRGISAKIRNAYSFIAHNYDFRTKQDQIILVGFSRGAFAAQCLASLISRTGLLEKKYLYYLRGLFTLWENQELSGGVKLLDDQVARLRKAGVLQNARIQALAVWDTVSSLASWTLFSPQPLAFVGKQVPQHVDYAFHALALDEKRSKFYPTVWESKEQGGGETIVSQCWFLGGHGDVGGNMDAALGAVTLLWMIGKLHDHLGVEFEEAEIAKHLKHKYLDWSFSQGTFSSSLHETSVLSTLPHSGLAYVPAWFWIIAGGWKPRTTLLKSTPSSGDLEVKMEVHFTVRLAMSLKHNISSVLSTWKTVSSSTSKVQWQSDDKGQNLNEQVLVEKGEENTEYDLLSKWCNGDFPNEPTDRTGFAELQIVIQDPNSKKGLENFAQLLADHMVFKEGSLAPKLMYPSPSAK